MKSIYKIFFLLYCITIQACQYTSATNYYISNSGNDSAPGSSPGAPWKTISKLNSVKLKAGDSIFFKSGDTWYEELIIRNSGNSKNHIVFSFYGKGEKPRILGSISLTKWTNIGENIWESYIQTSDPSRGANHNGGSKGKGGYPGGSWFEELDGSITWGHQEKEIIAADYSVLKQEYDWGWYNSRIYIFSPTNPGSRYKTMQVSQRQTCIKIPDDESQEYITIDGLELMFSQSKGFFSGYPEYKAHGLDFLNCHIGFIGIKGAASAYGLSVWHSDMLIKNNVINDCGRRGISYNLYTSSGKVFENVVIENNIFYNGFHTTSIDVSSLGTDTVRNFTFRNNLIYDDTAATVNKPEGFSSNSIYIETPSSSYYKNFYLYNNIVLNSKARSLLIGNIDSIYIYHNTFYGLNSRSKPYSMISFKGKNVVFFRNNIVYGNLPESSFDAYCILDENGKTVYAELDNNLYYQKDPNQILIGTGGSYFPASKWLTYRTRFGYDKNSPIPSDPMFVEPYRNLSLLAGSPAKGKGNPIKWIKTDFFGNPVNNPPDIGAIQYGPGDHNLKLK